MILQGSHTIQYEYNSPVYPGPHVVRLTPRSSARVSVRSCRLEMTPAPAGTDALLDAENNQVVSAWFEGETTSLTFYCRWEVETLFQNPFGFLLGSDDLPVRLAGSQASLLSPYLVLTPYPELEKLYEILRSSSKGPMDFALKACKWCAYHIGVEPRSEGGARASQETLDSGTGACRDISVLMMDLCRITGIPARFVSGYCYHGEAHTAHDLHSWVEAWIPDGGWRGFDPTLGLATTSQHVPVCASRNPAETLPVEGHIGGSAHASLNYRVDLKRLDSRL